MYIRDSLGLQSKHVVQRNSDKTTLHENIDLILCTQDFPLREAMQVMPVADSVVPQTYML